MDDGFTALPTSAAGLLERYSRGETAHTVHVWWARRPHTAMRALVFASLCRSTGQQARDLLHQLAGQPRVSREILRRAGGYLADQYPCAPRVLDMFGGGGTIGLEALDLGAAATSVDVNPLAVFIQRCLLVHARQGSRGGLGPRLLQSGHRVLDRLRLSTAPLFPARNRSGQPVFGYLWTYEHTCHACGYVFLLSRRPWLAKGNGPRVALRLARGSRGDVVELGDELDGARTAWVDRRAGVQCPRCQQRWQKVDVRECRDVMVATAALRAGSGKHYALATTGLVPETQELEMAQEEVLRVLGATLPASRLPPWSGIVNPAVHGIRTHAEVLNPRQRVVVLHLIKALREEHEALRKTDGPEIARAVLGLLSALVDQVLDWNCRLSTWIAQNGQVGRALSGPGIPMVWDYVETDVVMEGPANLNAKVKRVVAGVEFASRGEGVGNVVQAPAQCLPFMDNTFDAVVTDPPYYDNLYYSVLADFIYVWKRLLLRDLEPDLFGAESTEGGLELVASTHRSGSALQAHQDYCAQLAQALKEAERVLKNGAVLSLVFSHRSLNAWEALVQAFQSTRLVVTSVQPLGIERRQRPRAMTADAIHTCLVLVARKSPNVRRTLRLEEVVDKVRVLGSGPWAEELKTAGWSEADAGLALFSQGVGLLCGGQLGCHTRDALAQVVDAVCESHPSFTITSRASL